MLLLAAGLLSRGQPALEAVRPQAISAHVRFLSDDLLEGRYSGSPGHAVAERYVIAQLAALGVQPAGEGGGWLQRVALRQAKTDGSTLAASGAELGEAVIAGDGGASRDIEGQLSFVGYGLDDLGDLRGKIAVVLAGAPASLPPTERAIAGSNEAKLRRLGAAGAIAEVVLDTPELEERRPWVMVKRNFRNGQTFAADAVPPMPVAFLDLRDSERIQKAKTARLSLVQAVRAYESANVIGILPGASPEAIVYSAHLDHLGICEPQVKDPICLEIARGFSALAHRERSILFIAFTAEELGLLGSAWFSRHPTIPRERMVANLNFDQVLPAGPVRELVLRGAELSSLEDHVRAAAAELGIAIGPDPVPEQSFYARSDQINFARIGVPSACLWQGFGRDAAYEAAFKDFRAHRYHQPSDEWLPAYDWEAAAQMARVELLVGVSLLTGERPSWKPGSPFH